MLDAINLEVPDGSAAAVVGASGCGKTTLLRVIAGFETPDAGSVCLGAETVVGERFCVPPQRRKIGYVAQDGALFPHLSVADNIAYGLSTGVRGGFQRLRRRSEADRARITDLLAMVSLDASYADRKPHQLSGGQQQRVALARALARKPDLMLLDEPFSALDTGLRATTREAVAETLRAAGMTSILVTHDQEEALSFAEQVAVMRDGRFTQVGEPVTVYTRPADLFTAGFLGDTVLLDGVSDGHVAKTVLGDIAVQEGAPDGECTVMLRPEQLTAATGTGPHVVKHVDFRGPEVILTIELAEGAGTVRVRRAGMNAPQTGDRVQLTPHGTAMAYPK
ncbi:Fe(3+) ions import ATP-binding protein FbpC [Nocardia camponoti]|uniref:ABC-type quaternary amine transporter n=1 Tax=Nocardia camponoti TaxID=1616106 RepID=A0A917QL41_9NOCA|nr:Fe(3+) ions import ATP-binding protein FbpC [Nocardia camponoti]